MTYEIRMLAATHPQPLKIMQSQRHIEANILGYRLERIEEIQTNTQRYEVCAPGDGSIIARFENRPEAERFIVLRELRTVAMRPRHPAY